MILVFYLWRCLRLPHISKNSTFPWASVKPKRAGFRSAPENGWWLSVIWFLVLIHFPSANMDPQNLANEFCARAYYLLETWERLVPYETILYNVLLSIISLLLLTPNLIDVVSIWTPLSLTRGTGWWETPSEAHHMCLKREMRHAWAHHKGDTNVCGHLQSGQSVSHPLLQACPSELQVVGSEGRHTFLRISSILPSPHQCHLTSPGPLTQCVGI